DVSTLKKAEEDMRRSLEKERYLNELKTRFVSMASHEFRTPLTSIMNSVTLLSKYIDIEKNDGKSLNYIERIKTSIQHLNSILNDFLSLDKLEEGKLEINCSKFSVAQFFEEVIEEINSLIKKGQQIDYDHIGKEQVFIDKQMMFNIFNNLLSNAIKYSPENSLIKVETSVIKDNLTVAVTDYGIGIPENEQKHIFERFFRAKNTVNIQGTGLGLNIVKKYVDIVGGKIDFISTPSVKTTFIVTIPYNNNS
ncbi:MAG: HAMP domain-containing histidine kinase, partial [Cyclobacteriaceae bacterium]|nr:HAMP domain-containing histidine kinase [Cyclobacteriaceae bacterium]